MRASAGGPVPEVSFTLRGLVAGDGPAAVPIAPVCRVAHPAGDAAPVRPVGRYLIFCDGGGAPNYATYERHRDARRRQRACRPARHRRVPGHARGRRSTSGRDAFRRHGRPAAATPSATRSSAT
jgi:hypothetical protein